MAHEEGTDVRKVVNWCRCESATENTQVRWRDCHFVNYTQRICKLSVVVEDEGSCVAEDEDDPKYFFFLSRF